jgi:plasmid stabilization system protein ParE
VIEYSRRAGAQVDGLLDHYAKKNRPEAIINLKTALQEAEAAIQENPGVGKPAPRPYPALSRPGRLWLKSGRYWIAWRRRPVLKIVAVLHDEADIPNRV